MFVVLILFSHFQDDSYVDSYISTIGVDFVSLSLSLSLCSLCMRRYFKFCAGVAENQNCGVGWKDNQAADCELKLFIYFIYFYI
jgi:hypothetical protein